jgi:glutathione S-transferase
MTRPTVFGPTYSVYTRIARLALEEKGAPYDLVDVAMLSGAHKRPDFLQRNPFGKLPAFAHDTLSLYETGRPMSAARPKASASSPHSRG